MRDMLPRRHTRRQGYNCHQVPLSAAQRRLLPTRSFAECLQRGFSGRLRGLREIVKSLQTSVKKVVDRSGFEPLTSAVQRRQPL